MHGLAIIELHVDSCSFIEVLVHKTRAFIMSIMALLFTLMLHFSLAESQGIYIELYNNSDS